MSIQDIEHAILRCVRRCVHEGYVDSEKVTFMQQCLGCGEHFNTLNPFYDESALCPSCQLMDLGEVYDGKQCDKKNKVHIS